VENLFDLSAEYDSMLDKGLQLSGEDKFFFIKGRINDLKHQLPADFNPLQILDFGCGIGDGSFGLHEAFPNANISGADTSTEAMEYTKSKFAHLPFRFLTLDQLGKEENVFDLCYVNGVFHHIIPEERSTALSLIRNSLRPGGYLALFENNPWNPGTRLVMNRIPFDKQAQTINYINCRTMLRQAGFENIIAFRFLFYFPRQLKWFRSLEKYMTHLPLGAQYYALARKQPKTN